MEQNKLNLPNKSNNSLFLLLLLLGMNSTARLRKGALYLWFYVFMKNSLNCSSTAYLLLSAQLELLSYLSCNKGAQNSMQYSRYSLTVVKYSGTITFLVKLFLIQARMRLVFLPTWAHCSCSARCWPAPPGSLPANLPQAYTAAWWCLATNQC